MRFDLHTHSNHSDGTLTPTELVRRAVAQEVDVLALTDHDTLSGLPEAQLEADKQAIQLIPGVEVSVTWEGKTLHVLGLGVQTQCAELNTGLRHIRTLRRDRAQRMNEGLTRVGISGALLSISRCMAQENITRTHFARFLVAEGHAKNFKTAFNGYMKQGKAGYVKTAWPYLEDAVTWIKNAGGVAVLAHPGRYKLTATKMRLLLRVFKDCGGEGIEVITGRSDAQEVNRFSALANDFAFLASQGTDFHEPTPHGVKLGYLREMPSALPPVWQHESIAHFLTP